MLSWARPTAHPDFARDAAELTAELRAAVTARGYPAGEDFKGRELWTASWKRRGLRGLHKTTMVGPGPVFAKCVWCERIRDWRRELDVEHYRPRVRVTEWAGSPPLVTDSPPPEVNVGPGYWWLAFDWANLSLACKTCNEGWKRCLFPVRSPRPRYREGMEAEERALLVEPGSAFRTADHFKWTSDAFMLPNSEEGYATIVSCGLNRSELVTRRQKIALDVHEALGLLIRALRYHDRSRQEAAFGAFARLGSRTEEFTSMVRWFFEDRLGRPWEEFEPLPD